MGCEIPQLNSCCCGCTLKTGSKIIGWLLLIGNIILVIMFGLALAALYGIEDDSSVIPDSEPDKQQFLDMIPIMKIILYVMIAMSLTTCVLGFVLLMGVYENSTKLVFLWIVATLTITVIKMIMNFGLLFIDSKQPNGGGVVGTTIHYLLTIYALLVVYSHYREMHNVSSNA